MAKKSSADLTNKYLTTPSIYCHYRHTVSGDKIFRTKKAIIWLFIFGFCGSVQNLYVSKVPAPYPRKIWQFLYSYQRHLFQLRSLFGYVLEGRVEFLLQSPSQVLEVNDLDTLGIKYRKGEFRGHKMISQQKDCNSAWHNTAYLKPIHSIKLKKT